MTKQNKKPSPQYWYEILVPMSKYYKLERIHFFSLAGIRKFYEVSPIVALVAFATVSEFLYFSLYYPYTRTDVAYTRTPGYRNIALDIPKVCKFYVVKDNYAGDYMSYKPNLNLKNVLMEMYERELERFCINKKHCIHIDKFKERLLPYSESCCDCDPLPCDDDTASTSEKTDKSFEKLEQEVIDVELSKEDSVAKCIEECKKSGQVEKPSLF